LFEYDVNAPLDIKVEETERRGTTTVQDISFASPGSNKRIGAYLVRPDGDGPFAGALFVHWYDPSADNSNRTQFLDEAVLLAERGVVSLLVETFWSDLEWFGKRDRADDYPVSVGQVIDLRRGLDVIIAQPGVDPERITLVGHDFGGMFGAMLAGCDGRPGSYAIMAATPMFTDWYLLGPPMPEPARTEYVEQLAPLDPIRYVGQPGKAEFLFQFGTRDPYVPEEKALDFYNACGATKRIEWYDADHDIDVPKAHQDRIEWVLGQLGANKG
jgi:dienelactone hydrolase